jgi:hypothetical protein
MVRPSTIRVIIDFFIGGEKISKFSATDQQNRRAKGKKTKAKSGSQSLPTTGFSKSVFLSELCDISG